MQSVIQVVKKNFLSFIMFIAIIAMSIATCRKINSIHVPERQIDTTTIITYVIKDTIINKLPTLVQSGRDTIIEKSVKYLPSENHEELVKQFEDLKQKFLSRNVYSGTTNFDSSSVSIIDTVQNNRIAGRSVKFNMKYPIVTNTITITETASPKNHLYLGAEMSGSMRGFNQVDLGLVLENKKGTLFKVGMGVDYNGRAVYTGGLYKRIFNKNK